MRDSLAYVPLGLLNCRKGNLAIWDIKPLHLEVATQISDITVKEINFIHARIVNPGMKVMARNEWYV